MDPDRRRSFVPPSVGREGRRRPRKPSASLLRIALALLGIDPSWLPLPPPLRAEPPLGRRRSAVLDLCFSFDIYPSGGQVEFDAFCLGFCIAAKQDEVGSTRTYAFNNTTILLDNENSRSHPFTRTYANGTSAINVSRVRCTAAKHHTGIQRSESKSTSPCTPACRTGAARRSAGSSCCPA